MQNTHKYKSVKKIKQWTDTTIAETKKFLGLNILMKSGKKKQYKQLLVYGSTYKKSYASKQVQANITILHFCNNNEIPKNADRLFKIEPISDFFLKINFFYMFNFYK